MKSSIETECVDFMKDLYQNLNEGGDNALLEVRLDFLTCSFQELVCGDWFAGIRQDRKKDLMEQYTKMGTFFDNLRIFFDNHQQDLAYNPDLEEQEMADKVTGQHEAKTSKFLDPIFR